MLCQSSPSDQQSLSFYQRKLYALIQVLIHVPDSSNFSCLQTCPHDLKAWWQQYGNQITAIAKASDHLAFQADTSDNGNQPTQIEIRHLISGQSQTVAGTQLQVTIPNEILRHPDPQTVLLWLWRFHPELQVAQQQDALLLPSEPFMPDCPHHSYASTVSALTGAMFPKRWQPSQKTEAPYNPQPYLLLFTFSPVQEFIKASRKFLDFWAGSYLLHYLSAYLCWEITKYYGTDAVITPSLWGQEIIDALICQKYPDWKPFFGCLQGQDPIARFNDRTSTSLSTAGFPNVLTVLVPEKRKAQALGRYLTKKLKHRWFEIAENVREHIRVTVSSYISDHPEALWDREFAEELGDRLENPYYKELQQYQQLNCWEWRSLWAAQIKHTWEPYYVAVPLGHPDSNCPLQIDRADATLETWIQAQNDVARPKTPIPSPAEREAYSTINVGTWWGSYQGRLGQLIQAVKNTRNWQIPVAPGERSSLSGQYSAVHPRLNYGKFQNGRGMTATSMRLFWKVMKYAYPGVFNGSEKLNAIELTKRMAWKEGGVAAELGIRFDQEEEYENLIRFPNLSSIAAAKFASEHPERVQQYWTTLRSGIYNDLSLKAHHDRFCSLTRRPFQVKRADDALNQLPNVDKGYNGVMFSSKWLADDLGLQTQAELSALRDLVTKTHQKHNFGDSSPADWWVLVMGDGDGMGNYVSGGKLKPYREYVIPIVRTVFREKNPEF